LKLSIRTLSDENVLGAIDIFVVGGITSAIREKLVSKLTSLDGESPHSFPLFIESLFMVYSDAKHILEKVKLIKEFAGFQSNE